jgi:hypothetical protein
MTQETNYNTRETMLWLDNEQGSYNAFVDYTEELLENDLRGYEIADALKEYFEEMYSVDEVYDSLPSGPLQSLFNFAVEQIDWYEIADHYIDIVNDNRRYNNEEPFDI